MSSTATLEPTTPRVRSPRRPRWTDDAMVGKFRFGVARETAVLDAAFRLVHDQYVWRGFMTAPHSSGRRVNLHHALPTTRVFVASDDERVVGTASFIPDSPLGLPMDEVFADQLDPLRRQGRRLSEASSLAMDADRRAHGFPVLIRLLRLVVRHAAEVARFDHLCMVVRPQHAEFYQQFFAAQILGEPRDYEKVHIDGAVALQIDLEAMRALIRDIHAGDVAPTEVQEFLYGPATHRTVLAQLQREAPAGALTAEQFARFFRGQDVLAEAPPTQSAYVMSFYEADAPDPARHPLDR